MSLIIALYRYFGADLRSPHPLAASQSTLLERWSSICPRRSTLVPLI